MLTLSAAGLLGFVLGAPPSSTPSTQPSQPPPPVLRLPAAPDIEEKRIESDPPNARIDWTVKFSPFTPWILGGAGVTRRITSPGSFGAVADVRLGLPIAFWGQNRVGLGFAPTASIRTIGHFRDHISTGLAFGILEERRDRHTGSSALVLIGEVTWPFTREGNVKTGGTVALLFMARGPWVSLGYTRFGASPDDLSALWLTVGLNFFEVAQ